MNEKIFIRIKFSVDDYVRVLTFMRNQLFINKYISIILPTILFPAIVFGVYQSAGDKDLINWSVTLFAGLIPATVGGVIIYALDKFLSTLLLKRTVAKQYKSSPAMQEETDVVISDQGLESSNKLSSGVIKWEGIIKAVESETDFIFYTTSKFGHFIPKNVFVSETDVDFLRCLSRAKLGDKAKF